MKRSVRVAMMFGAPSRAVLLVSLLASGAAIGEGLKLREREATADMWPQWQARRTVLAAPAQSLGWWSSPAALAEGSAATLLVGDYLFARPSFGWWPAGGQLRASTGLVLSSRVGHGLRGPEASSAQSASLPYVGLGYSGFSAKGGWSISADLGLTAGTRAGSLLGSQSFDSAWRELRFAPMVQVGVRYSF